MAILVGVEGDLADVLDLRAVAVHHADLGGESAPVQAGRDARQAEPVQRRELREHVHGVAHVLGARHRVLLDDLAERLEALNRRLAERLGRRFRVAGDEQEALAPLAQAADLAAAVEPRVDPVAGVLQKADELQE